MIYLYAKQHNVTGLRYFGKTTQDPYRYPGSGLHWRRHLAKHGKDVTTTWVHAYDDAARAEEEALFFSRVYNIVASPEWANMKPENGRDGWQKGIPNPRSVPQSEETRRKKSIKLKGTYKSARYGADNGRYGIKASDETRAKISAALSNKPRKPWTEERRAKVAATWAKKLELNNT